MRRLRDWRLLRARHLRGGGWTRGRGGDGRVAIGCCCCCCCFGCGLPLLSCSLLGEDDRGRLALETRGEVPRDAGGSVKRGREATTLHAEWVPSRARAVSQSKNSFKNFGKNCQTGLRKVPLAWDKYQQYTHEICSSAVEVCLEKNASMRGPNSSSFLEQLQRYSGYMVTKCISVRIRLKTALRNANLEPTFESTFSINRINQPSYNHLETEHVIKKCTA